jgi:hypothetical protein
LTDARKLALFKVLLKGTAGDWLDTLSVEITNDYEQLMAAFKARYQNPDKERYKSAKDLFTLKQKPDQATEDYVAHMKKLVGNLGVKENDQDKVIFYAMLNGVKRSVAGCALQQKATTLQDIITAARLVELTEPTSMATDRDDSILCRQLAEVQSEVRRLATKLDRGAATAITSGRSPTPERRVTWNDRQTAAPTPTTGTSSTMTGPRRGSWNPRFGQGGRGGQQGQQPQQSGQQNCTRCGNKGHFHPNYCPAIGRECNFCHKPNHFSKMCRGAARARAQNQQ